MPKYVCDTCRNEFVIDLNYATMRCSKCKGVMRLVGSAPPPPIVTKPGSQSSLVSTRPVTQPAIDISELSLVVVTKKEAREANAAISKKLEYTMTYGASTTSYVYPIKYRIWVSERVRQSKEITVEIPIKVHSGFVSYSRVLDRSI